MAEEVDGTGSALARYAMGPGIDQPLSMLRGGVTSYYQADGLGSITSLTDGSGSLAATYTYDAFGKPVGSSGTIVNPFRYTGREFDTETGLHYYRARYLDTATGRFTSEDPMTFSAGPNFYTYVWNQPTTYVDPLGLLAELYCERIPSTRGGGFVADLILLVSQSMHCFVRVACGGLDQTLELYGPPEQGKYGIPARNPFNPKRGGRKFNIYPPSRLKCCEFEKRLIDGFNRERTRLPLYNPKGPNSNTFANQIIMDAGGYADFPLGAYGPDIGVRP